MPRQPAALNPLRINATGASPSDTAATTRMKEIGRELARIAFSLNVSGFGVDGYLHGFHKARSLLEEAESLAGPKTIGEKTVDAYDAEVRRLLPGDLIG